MSLIIYIELMKEKNGFLEVGDFVQLLLHNDDNDLHFALRLFKAIHWHFKNGYELALCGTQITTHSLNCM